MMKKIWPVLALALFLTGPAFPQDNNNNRQTITLTSNAQLALSTADYRVTSGDVYTLAYMAAGQKVEYSVAVDSTYRIRVSNLGVIDASGKTYGQLKTQVETIVSNNYPLSGVQFVLTQPAVFVVTVRGEVKEAAEVSAGALSRLSSVLGDRLTAYSSIRDIEVLSAGGQSRVFDLYQARRTGDLMQDPYLRPGDAVIVKRAARQVTLSGAVERPGTYQLLEGENLKELIETYGSGFTVRADRTRVDLLRVVGSGAPSGDKIFLSEDDFAGNYELADQDGVTVPERTALRPVIFVEGAVGTGAEANPAAATRAADRLVVPFNPGENYAALIRRNQSWFSAVSDTKNAYIIRGDEHIAINLNPMLYDSSYRSEIEIAENDTLIIPFRQYFVTVAGAVMAPGRYPYIPDREWDYYIALAGGFRPGQNAFQAVSIRDMTGKRMKKSDVITPETIITAQTNDGLYYFNQYAPVFMTTLSIITTYLTLQNTFQNR
jgi:protein involved in polysaccharide export with SLBB domain